jgi:hypothetical protein
MWLDPVEVDGRLFIMNSTLGTITADELDVDE